jgi:hypothetical protein
VEITDGENQEHQWTERVPRDQSAAGHQRRQEDHGHHGAPMLQVAHAEREVHRAGAALIAPAQVRADQAAGRPGDHPVLPDAVLVQVDKHEPCEDEDRPEKIDAGGCVRCGAVDGSAEKAKVLFEPIQISHACLLYLEFSKY